MSCLRPSGKNGQVSSRIKDSTLMVQKGMDKIIGNTDVSVSTVHMSTGTEDSIQHLFRAGNQLPDAFPNNAEHGSVALLMSRQNLPPPLPPRQNSARNNSEVMISESNMNEHKERERSATTELPAAAVSMPVVMSCASMHEIYHWPECTSMKENSQPVYNCFQYELSDGAHVVMSADAKGIHASGACADKAIEDFYLAIRTRLEDKLGGLYPGTSDFDFQDLYFRDIEQGWEDDGVKILQKHRVSINITDGAVVNA